MEKLKQGESSSSFLSPPGSTPPTSSTKSALNRNICWSCCKEQSPPISHPAHSLLCQPLQGDLSSSDPQLQSLLLPSEAETSLKGKECSLNILRLLRNIFLSPFCLQSEKDQSGIFTFSSYNVGKMFEIKSILFSQGLLFLLLLVWFFCGSFCCCLAGVFWILFFWVFFGKDEHVVPWSSSMKSKNAKHQTEDYMYFVLHRKN